MGGKWVQHERASEDWLPVAMRVFCVLAVSMWASWWCYCTVVLQDDVIRETWKGYTGSLRVISYNCI